MEIVLIKTDDNEMYIGNLTDKYIAWETLVKPDFVYTVYLEDAYKLTGADFPVYVDKAKFLYCSNIKKLDNKELNYIKLVNKHLYNKIITKYEVKGKEHYLVRKSFKYELKTEMATISR